MVLLFDQKQLLELIKKSYSSLRQRAALAIHAPEKKGYRIVINCIQPGSYMQPHLHKGGSESWIIQQGQLFLILFDNTGKVKETLIISPKGKMVVDIPPQMFHTAIVIDKDTIIYELSDGPYDSATYKEFAQWAPSEGNQEAAKYLQNLQHICEERHGQNHS